MELVEGLISTSLSRFNLEGVFIVPTQSITAIKFRRKLPLLLERVGVRRIK
jgi:hypothetical protein